MPLLSSRNVAGFRLFGFPIQIRIGFFFVAVFFFGRNTGLGASYILWSFVAYAAFMIIHEVGHAAVARRFGCQDISISLDFLMGYAMFRPPSTISKARLALISVAGPLSQIVAGSTVLAAMGAKPTSLASMLHGTRGTVFWFGPLLGLANLIPILPLDGGNIAALGLESLSPGSGRSTYQRISLALSIAMAVFAITGDHQGLRYALLYPGIMLTIMNLTGLQSRPATGRPATVDLAGLAASAETRSWGRSSAVPFPPDTGPSPWLLAHHARLSGDLHEARQHLLNSLTVTQGYWQLPDDAPQDALLALVDLLPDPSPVDDLHGARTYHHVLHRLGYLRKAAEYGARIYERHRDPFTAHQVATELALLGHGDHAMAWLSNALADPAEQARLSDPALDSLRGRPDWQALFARPLPPPVPS
jgi:Zn-dependent protease